MASSAEVVVEGTKLKAANFLQAFIASWEFDAFVAMARRHRATRATAKSPGRHGASGLGARGEVKRHMVTGTGDSGVRTSSGDSDAAHK